MIKLITGYGRSGTTFIAQNLNKINGVKCLHESCKLYKEIYLGKNNKEFLKNYYQKLYDNNINIEVDSHYRTRLKDVKYIFEINKIYILIRNGKDVVRSALNKPLPEWLNNYLNSLPGSTKLEKYCYCWINDMKKLFNDIEKYNFNSTVYKFENFTSNVNYLKSMANEITGINTNIEFNINKVNFTKSTVYDWKNKDDEIFEKIAGNFNKHLGY